MGSASGSGRAGVGTPGCNSMLHRGKGLGYLLYSDLGSSGCGSAIEAQVHMVGCGFRRVSVRVSC